jgi:hypothetical protein
VDEGVSALGKSWHRECFKCVTCHVLLENASFRHNEEKAYCEACYLHQALIIKSIHPCPYIDLTK